MKIVSIAPNFIKFEFIENMDRVSYTTNVFALIHNSRVVLIDSGYLEYSKLIKDYFDELNLTVDSIIITHYHRDHCEGSLTFPKAKIYASNDYMITMKRLLKHYDQNLYKTPDFLIANYSHLEFGSFNIKIYKTPGHTPCSISIILNDFFLIPSDLLLQDINGKNIIPYMDIGADPNNHLKSLRKFQILDFKEICLSHGYIIHKNQISSFITERIYYLERFIESHYTADLEYCLMQDKSQYAMTEIHRVNLRNGKKLKA
ncbi:MAG: MBL fold metallo-hydrolase [Clostridia bacterium]|nr:MBL fold metallo-hydrolase [Clostridia bacterium]